MTRILEDKSIVESVSTLEELKAIPTYVSCNKNVVITANSGDFSLLSVRFLWKPDSMEVPDDYFVIKPDDVDIANPGRWHKHGLFGRKPGIVQLNPKYKKIKMEAMREVPAFENIPLAPSEIYISDIHPGWMEIIVADKITEQYARYIASSVNPLTTTLTIVEGNTNLFGIGTINPGTINLYFVPSALMIQNRTVSNVIIYASADVLWYA